MATKEEDDRRVDQISSTTNYREEEGEGDQLADDQDMGGGGGGHDDETLQLMQQEGEEGEGGRKMKTVLLAFDNSEGSVFALNWALDTLFFKTTSRRSCSSSSRGFEKLVILHAFEPFHQYFFPARPGVYVTPLVIDSAKRGQEEKVTRVLARAVEICDRKEKNKTIVVETKRGEGDPKEMICHVADQIHADLVVLGSRGLGMIKRAFLGSVSDYVTHHAKCPVLIVKPPNGKH